MNKEQLQKNSWYQIDNGLGPIRAQLLESPRQGKGWKTALLMDVKGSDRGFFDEIGSVYLDDIQRPLRSDEITSRELFMQTVRALSFDRVGHEV